MNKFLTIILVFICLTGSAQTETSLELEKKINILDITPLGKDGFLVNTGSSKDIQLTFFNADLSKRWISKFQTTADTYSNGIIVSPGGNNTYLIDVSGFYEESKSSVVDVVHIDSTGRPEAIGYKINKDQKGTQGIALFADDDNLYRLGAVTTFTLDNGKKEIASGKETGKKESKIVLFIMNKSEKEVRLVETDIKLIAEHVYFYNYQFMEYLGHDNEYIYLAKKNVNQNQNIVTYEVYTLNRSGKTVKTNKFVASIDGKITKATNLRNVPGAVVYNKDSPFEFINGTWFHGAHEGLYGCVKLDLSNGYLYIYGLARSNKFPVTRNGNEEQKANAIYVCKFDFNTGNLINKNETQFNQSIMEDIPFAGLRDGFRDIWFDIVDSETVRLCGTVENMNGLLHVTVINTRTGKTAYIGREIKPHLTAMGITLYRFFANALVTRLDASQKTIDYINKFPDFNEKHFQVFGICLGDKTLLGLKSAHKVEFHLLDNSNR